MPELPDVQVFSSNLNKIFAGKKLISLNVVNGKKLKDTEEELVTNVDGKTLTACLIQGEVKEFLKIHTCAQKESSTGSPIIIDSKGARKTYYTEEQVLYK